MKAFITYWTIGSIVAGVVTVSHMHDCPNDRTPLGGTTEMVATWPMAFGIVLDFIFQGPPPAPAMACQGVAP